jgi:7,8-dihydro-6-hydroxymethylpterin-pyrophosphokinase
LTERAFVLVPLTEVAEGLLLPDGRSVDALLAQVDAAGIEPLP